MRGRGRDRELGLNRNHYLAGCESRRATTSVKGIDRARATPGAQVITRRCQQAATVAPVPSASHRRGRAGGGDPGPNPSVQTYRPDTDPEVSRGTGPTPVATGTDPRRSNGLHSKTVDVG